MKIYNLKGKNYPSDAVLVDRSTPFGNPFRIGKDGTRDQVCEKFATWIADPKQAGLKALGKKALKGKDLLCWCTPERCHAETWIKIANEEPR